jgi:hypothetical protein
MPKPKKLVVINGRYTFETEFDLKVGDEVVLEGSNDHQWIGEVTATESTYKGNCRKVVRKWVGNLSARISFQNIDELKIHFKKLDNELDVRMVATALWNKTKGYQFSQPEKKFMLEEIAKAAKAELKKYQPQEAV